MVGRCTEYLACRIDHLIIYIPNMNSRDDYRYGHHTVIRTVITVSPTGRFWHQIGQVNRGLLSLFFFCVIVPGPALSVPYFLHSCRCPRQKREPKEKPKKKGQSSSLLKCHRSNSTATKQIAHEGKIVCRSMMTMPFSAPARRKGRRR